jgi:adenosine deaminase
MESVKQNGVGMTICPCAYVRHTPEGEMFPRKRKLFDDPVYMEDNWLGDNVILVRDKCGFTDREMLQLQMSALEMFWVGEEDRRVFLDEFEKFERDRC